MRPLIGISMGVMTTNNGRSYHRSYAMNSQAIADAGGLPVYIGAGLPDDVLRELYDRLDGILLPGGGDMRPSLYGAEANPLSVEIDDARDALEVTLAKWAYEEDLPMLGICRGHQVVNVALGGTLVQDIPSEIGTDVVHSTSDQVPRSTLAHPVTLVPGTRLAEILGGLTVEVNSLHHQSVERLAPGLVISALSPDDEIIEALESPDKTFALSVQWHPEDLYRSSEAMTRLFTTFVDAARENMRRKQMA